MRVELDKKALFALASDTRLEILKTLNPMRRTITQLAEALEIDKAAVFRHIKKLEEGEFVKRYEDHGFIYYGLTWKARDILDPKENTKIVILISCAYILLLASVIVLALVLGTGSSMYAGMEEGAGHSTLTDSERSASLVMAIWLVSVVGLMAIGIALFVIGIRRLRGPKQVIGP